MRALELVIVSALLSACAKKSESTDHAPAPSSSIAPSASSLAADATQTSAADASVAPLTVDDRCVTSDDCVPVDLFVEGDLRCCLACGATVAASKAWASSFANACAAAKEMRECPIEECQRPPIDARCVGKRCYLVPRPKSSVPSK